MKLLKTTGFTIIETMLFLAISGFLFVAILASTGNAVNTQRYHDSVYSLQSFIQDQYSEIVNVSNEEGQRKCSNGGDASRGQSECVILGRYISTANDGGSLNVYKVIGSEEPSASADVDDIDIFKQYNIYLYKLQNGELDVETYDFEWGAKLTNDDVEAEGVVSHFSILLLRSPNSGIVRTFADPSKELSPDEKFKDLIADIYTKNEIKACVDSNGILSGPRSAVLIHANAAVQSDIEVIGDKDSGC